MESRTKWKILAATVLVGVLMFFSITATAEGIIVYEQSPGHFGGFLSDGQIFTVADEFQIDEAAVISSVTWWGGYTSMLLPETDNFAISFYTDDGGKPGELIQTFDVSNDAARTATGDYVNPPDPEVGFEGGLEYRYSFDLPVQIPVDADTRYWLSIVNMPSSDSWVWEVSSSLVNLGVQRSFENGPWEPYYDNTAFQLQTAEIEPPLSVEIDIRPFGFLNIIKLDSRLNIPVAILSSPTFDALSQVDKTSLTFGRIGDEPSLMGCFSFPMDVNGDGLMDLVCKFSIQAAGFQLNDTVGVLKGMTIAGQPFAGTDTVRILP